MLKELSALFLLLLLLAGCQPALEPSAAPGPANPVTDEADVSTPAPNPPNPATDETDVPAPEAVGFSYEGIQFEPGDLATAVAPAQIEGQVGDDDMPYWVIYPPHYYFTLEGYPLADSWTPAQLSSIPPAPMPG
jgi:hypothetical protein